MLLYPIPKIKKFPIFVNFRGCPFFWTALSYWTKKIGCKSKTILFTHENTCKLKLTFICFYLLLPMRMKEKWGKGKLEFEVLQSVFINFSFHPC